MKKLCPPQYDPLATYDACVDAVANSTLRNLYQTNRTAIQQANTAFDTATQVAAWCSLPRVPRGNGSILVAGALSKTQLVDLYTDYMVGTTGSSRDIYDDLLTAAGGLCPFCGGLGHVRTLDHYLPKANFPAFSVHPSNLVPCCRDCNTGKNASFGLQACQQTLHPYLDHERFFSERWISATVHADDPVLLTYACVPPATWSDHDKDRVRHHFVDYNIAYRFSVQAGAEVAKVVRLRASSLSKLSSTSFRDYLLDNADCNDFVLNGWSRTMYVALASADWFIQTDFKDLNWPHSVV